MKPLAALLAAFPLAALGQYDPSNAPSSPPPQGGGWETTPPPQQPPPTQQPPPPPAQPAPAQGQPAQPAPAPAYPPPPSYAPAYPPPAYPPAPTFVKKQQRGPWYIGFGLGSGDGSITGGGETHSFSWFGAPSPTTIGLNFKMGVTLNPKLLLGLDIGALSTQGDLNGTHTNIQATYYDASLLFFPQEKGFFLRGGAGPCALTIDLDQYGSATYHGFDVLAGVGYAFWLGQSFNLTVNLEGVKQWYSGTNAPDSAQFWHAYLGFDWY